MMNELFDPRSQLVIRNPYSFYERFRLIDPVHFGIPLHKELEGTWYLFNYSDINQVLKSKDFVRTPPSKSIQIVPSIYQNFKTIISKWLVFHDPPSHTRIRSVLNHAFSGRSIKNIENVIESIAAEIIAEIDQKQDIEFISQFALPFPIRVICKILGVPKEDKDKFEELSMALLAASFSVAKKNQEVFILAENAMQEFVDYFKAIINYKKHKPSEDIISLMIEGGINDKLDEIEIVSNCIHLLNAGFETTINVIAKGVYSLQLNKDFYIDFKENLANYSSLVEELLRYDGSVQMVTRWAKEKTVIAGKTIKAGNQVVLMLGAANRDPKIFEAPNCLKLNRKNMHLSFGGGIHYCLGSALARIEAKVAFKHLDNIITNYKLNTQREDAIVWNSSIVFHGFKRLWLKRTT